jgi:hypothetical protein
MVVAEETYNEQHAAIQPRREKTMENNAVMPAEGGVMKRCSARLCQGYHQKQFTEYQAG